MIPETFGELVLGGIVLMLGGLAFSVIVLLIAWILDKTGMVNPPEGNLVITEADDE